MQDVGSKENYEEYLERLDPHFATVVCLNPGTLSARWKLNYVPVQRHPCLPPAFQMQILFPGKPPVCVLPAL
jgi:hypothetical protein